jgi:hypothetical protein
MERKIKGGTIVGFVEQPKADEPKEKAEKPAPKNKK